MSTELIIAIVTAIAALASGILSVHSLQVANRMEEHRMEVSKAEMVDQLMTKYRDPLVRAAFDLQSRLYNIIVLDFLGKYHVRGEPDEKDYADANTLHVIGEYFAWVEILRRDVQFLDLRDVGKNRLLMERLEKISEAFFVDDIDEVFRAFRGEQRAIGEVMAVPGDTGGRTCIGYAAFVERLKEPEFRRWFQSLTEDIELLAGEPGEHVVRLKRLQHALIDLIDLMDPDFRYFPKGRRGKITDEQVAAGTAKAKTGTEHGKAAHHAPDAPAPVPEPDTAPASAEPRPSVAAGP